MIFMIKKPSEGTYLGRIIKRAQYFFDSLARYIHFYQTPVYIASFCPLATQTGRHWHYFWLVG